MSNDSVMGSAAEAEHSPTYWQTREVEFDRKNWAALLPKKGNVTAITPQFCGDVVAIVWGRDDKQEAANAALIVKSVNAVEPMREALLRLANAADRVGMRHFDTDDNSPEVEEMSEATLNARAALKLAGDAT